MYLKQFDQTRGAFKIYHEMHPRQPYLQLVEHYAVLQANCAKQLRLGKLKETNVRAVKNDASCVDVPPPHTLFDREFLVIRHRDYANTLSRNLTKAKLNCSVCSRFET